MRPSLPASLQRCQPPRCRLGCLCPAPVWRRQNHGRIQTSSLRSFEGPLDLLLYLIKKEEVDIYEVNSTRLATQFIEYIETMRMLDLEVAGEFLVMAATLMYIKSRELLPVDQQVAVEARTRRRILAGNSSASSSNTKNSRTPPGNCRSSKPGRKTFSPACRASWNSSPIHRPPSPRCPFSTC